MEPFLTTKLFIPPTRRGLVTRPRLIERLNKGLHAKLTLISAPAGFGKSTLISEWSRSLEKPVSWLSLDEDDNNPKRFFTYLITAFQAIDDSMGENLLDLLETADAPPIETLVTLLINEILTSEYEFTMVLDDYHLITNTTVHEALDYFLDHLPANTHLIMSGRVDPPFALSRLRARGHMLEIRSGDLRFTESEVSTLLNELAGLDLSSEQILALSARTEGWITGLQLAALSMQGRQDVAEFITSFSGSHHYIIDYLVDEVMSRQSEEVQNFLCQTSILDQFNAPLCDTVLEISNSKQIIQELDAANLFLVPLDDQHNWFRYHHLFADFLNQRLKENRPENISLLHRRAAFWLEQNQYIKEAIEYYLTGEDYQNAARLVGSIVPEMMMHSEFDQLEKWFNAMPREAVEKHHWICVARAWIFHRRARMEYVEQQLHCIEQALDSEPNPEPTDETKVIRGQIAALRALLALNKTRIPQAIEFSEQALALLPVGYFNRAVACLALGKAKGSIGNYLEANSVLIQAYRDSLDAGNRVLAQSILLEKGSLLVNQGRLHQALEIYEEAVELTYSKTEARLPYASEASIIIGKIHREWNALDTALTYVNEGIEIGINAQIIDPIAIGYAVMTRIYLAQGNLDAAIEASREGTKCVRDLPGLDPCTITEILNSQTWVHIAQGKVDEAAKLYLENSPCDVNTLNCYGEFEQVTWARILLHMGRNHRDKDRLLEAQALVNQMLGLTEPMGFVSKTIELLVLDSLIFRELGKSDEALQALEKALVLAESGSYIRTFIDEGEPMQELLARIAAKQHLKDYASRLLIAFDSTVTSDRPAASQEMAEPLSERELDVLKFLATDLTGSEIAQELMVSLATVRTHTQHIYGKLGVNSRRAAVRQAREWNLI